MPLETINNGDSGLIAREKINAAINAINAMTSTTTTSTSTTTQPTTTSSTTSTSTTTIPTTTTSSTTTSSTTTSSTSTTTMPTSYNYMITNCAGGASYTISTTFFLSSANVYKFFAPGAAYDTNACWQVTPSGMGGTLSTVTNTFSSCIECTSGTTTSTTTYTPPTTSTTTIP
jgi:hypothetical protein